MTLNLLRLDPDPARTALWMSVENVLREGHDDGYGWHALLAASFGPLAPKPFRVLSRPNRPSQLLAYSAEPLEKLQAHARDFADPLVAAALRPERAAQKAMPALGRGRRLGFEIRLRPTIRCDREGDRDRVVEIDAYVAACHAKSDEATPDRATVYREWMTTRLASAGARIETARPVEMRRLPLLRRRRDRRLTTVEGHSVTFSGNLITEDEEAFASLLASGMGRHRAFGYGMLLLRPPEA